MRLDPREKEHTLELVPRYYPCNLLYFYIKQGNDIIFKEEDVTYYVRNNKLIVEFTLSSTDPNEDGLREGSEYSVILQEAGVKGEVVFRGKLKITKYGTKEEYKLTTGKFYY